MPTTTSPGQASSPTNAVFYNPQQFSTITGFGTGTIYYRTNYSPWVAYTGPFTTDGQAIIDYYVSSSQVASLTNEFVAKFQVAQPSFTPVGQVESGPITLTASCSTTNAAIYYDMGDINGNWPSFIGATSATGPVYSGGLTPYTAFIWPPGNVSFTSLVNLYTNSFAFDGQTTRMFVFIGRKVGYYDSTFTNTVYTAILPLPVSALGNNITISVPTVNTLHVQHCRQLVRAELCHQYDGRPAHVYQSRRLQLHHLALGLGQFPHIDGQCQFRPACQFHQQPASGDGAAGHCLYHRPHAGPV